MAQPVVLYHSTTDNDPPGILMAGQMAVGLGVYTRVWIGDGTINRLLLSNSPGDTPIFSVASNQLLSRLSDQNVTIQRLLARVAALESEHV